MDSAFSKDKREKNQIENLGTYSSYTFMLQIHFFFDLMV